MSACEMRRSRSRGVGARLQHLKPLVRSRELRSVRSRTLRSCWSHCGLSGWDRLQMHARARCLAIAPVLDRSLLDIRGVHTLRSPLSFPPTQPCVLTYVHRHVQAECVLALRPSCVSCV